MKNLKQLERKKIKEFAIFLKELDDTITSTKYVERFIETLIQHQHNRGRFWFTKIHKPNKLLLKVHLCKEGWLPQFRGTYEETGKSAAYRIANLPKSVRFVKIRVSTSEKNTAIVPLKQLINELKNVDVLKALDNVLITNT